MQLYGKFVEHKTGVFDKGDESIAYDHILIADEDVSPELGVEYVNAKIKPPRTDALKVGYAAFAKTTPGTVVRVTVEADKFGGIRFRSGETVK